MSRRNWDVLDEDFSGGKAEEVSYVGTVDDDDDSPATIVREPVRAPQRTRVVAASSAPRAPIYRRAPQTPQRPYGPATEAGRHHATFGLISGNALTLNDEAMESLEMAQPTEMNGKMVRRAMPGTYVVFAEDQSRGMGGGMVGGETYTPGQGQAYDAINAAIGEQTWYPEYSQPAAAQQQAPASGGSDLSWIGQLVAGVGTAAQGITQTVLGHREQEAQLGLQREQMQLEAAAASDAAATAREEAARQHELALEQIRSRRDELEALREETAAIEEERARQTAARSGLAPVSRGTSPVVWLLLGLLGLGAIGGGIYYLTKKE